MVMATPSKPIAATPNPTITQRDLARRLGVGQVSISRALAGDPAVAPDLRDRILAAAAELGYRRNASAKAMRTGRHGTIGLLLGEDPERSAVPADLLWGLQEDLRDQGLRLAISWLTDAELREPAVLHEWSIDGALVFYTHDIPADAPARLAAQVPACLWLNADLAQDCVLPDDRAASVELGRRLAELGHRKVVFVGHGAGFTHYARDERRDGMRVHLEVTMVDIASWGEPKDRLEAATRWLAETRPTAVVAHEADCLVPVWAAAQRLALHLPRDLSLATFTNQPIDRLGITVSAMRVPTRALAAQAVAGLMARIASPTIHLAPQRVPLIFSDGGTLGPPPTQESV